MKDVQDGRRNKQRGCQGARMVSTVVKQRLVLQRLSLTYTENSCFQSACKFAALPFVESRIVATVGLVNGDRLEYLRANEGLNPTGVKLDVAAHEYPPASRKRKRQLRPDQTNSKLFQTKTGCFLSPCSIQCVLVESRQNIDSIEYLDLSGDKSG
jgi:hypothetical protein